MGATGDVTGLLKAASGGDPVAMKRLWPLVEERLHTAAQDLMRTERRNHTLQATALVNEAYLDLVDQRRAEYKDRLHFCRVAAMIQDFARPSQRSPAAAGLRWSSHRYSSGRACCSRDSQGSDAPGGIGVILQWC